jgi:hypothetical protein
LTSRGVAEAWLAVIQSSKGRGRPGFIRTAVAKYTISAMSCALVFTLRIERLELSLTGGLSTSGPREPEKLPRRSDDRMSKMSAPSEICTVWRENPLPEQARRSKGRKRSPDELQLRVLAGFLTSSQTARCILGTTSTGLTAMVVGRVCTDVTWF